MNGPARRVHRPGSLHASREKVLGWLAEVMDPEVPVVSVVDLGIVRDVQWQAHVGNGTPATLVVTVTPTYSGCPATELIARSIRDILHAHGVELVEVRTQLAPAWTTDWMSIAGREALRRYGIAPPAERAPDRDATQTIDIGALARNRVAVPCPLCGSPRTHLLSQFGSTACKALYRCHACLEAFDYFKPH